MSGAAPPETGSPHEPQRVLVLQGGGALGAYQAGVFEALTENGFTPDWLAGISIGAINSALIAGNPPEKRLAALRDFWETASSSLPFTFELPNEKMRALVNEAAAAWIAAAGVNGFFKPRIPPAPLHPPGTPGAISFYDTAPLRETLNRLIDFDRINGSGIRLSLGAVNISTGHLCWFDSTKHKIRAEHVMASGALPPGFPPVEIDGQHYWDGGVVSNTPLHYVLDEEKERDLLVFQVDLFNGEGRVPRTLLEAQEREKDIRFAGHTRHSIDSLMREHRARTAVRDLLTMMPPELRETPEAKYLTQLSHEAAMTIVKLVYRRKPYEGPSKDYEFSRQTMLEHWAAGMTDVARIMARRGELTCQRHLAPTKLIEVEA